MKKVLSLFLITILLLSFSACGKKRGFDGSPDDIPALSSMSTSINTHY